MFEGMDDIDWGSLRHAYGSASDLPEFVRGLLAPDPAESEEALTDLEMSVFEFGASTEATAPVVPFLAEAARAPGLHVRQSLVGFLAEIGGAGWFDDLVPEESDGDPDEETHWVRSEQAVADELPVFERLLADPDPGVRMAACLALTVPRVDVARAFTALRGRWDAEEDKNVRIHLVAAVGRLGRLAARGRARGAELDGMGAWLTGITDTCDRAVRLDVLAELGSIAPHRLPAGHVRIAVGLLEEFAEREGVNPDELRTRVDLQSARLGERVEDRTELLTALLSSDNARLRQYALRPAHQLMRRWRGDHTGLVRAVGARLADPDPDVRERAAASFAYLYGVAAPAADALADSLRTALRSAPAGGTAHRPNAWMLTWPSQNEPTPGPVLEALAGLGDPRALPAVEWVMENAEPYVFPGLAAFGAGLEPLLPLIRRRLREEGDENRRARLIAALGAAGSAAVADLTDLLPETAALRALERMGEVAETAPLSEALAEAAGTADIVTAGLAARLLWTIRRDPDPLLRVAARADDEEFRGLLYGVAELGPRAAALEGRVRAVLAAPDQPEYAYWLARKALWRITGDSAVVLPSLLEKWDRDRRFGRSTIADLLAELGPAAAEAAPRLRAELRTRSRVWNSRSSWYGGMVRDDEAVLASCRAALRAIGDRH